MKGKEELILIITVALICLLIAGCDYNVDPRPPANNYCGDGYCGQSETVSCPADCPPDTTRPTELNWIEQKINERKNDSQNGNNPNNIQDENTSYHNYGSINNSAAQAPIFPFPIETALPEKDFIVASRYNFLAIGENISGVVGTLTGTQLPLTLAGGTLQSNTEAFGPRSAYYQQKLNLRSGRVVFGYDEDKDIVSTFLEYKEGDPVWEYVLVLNWGIMKFFQDEKIGFLGHEYALSEITNQTMLLTSIDGKDSILLRNGHSAVVDGLEIPPNILNVSFTKQYIKVIVQAPKDLRLLPGEPLTRYVPRNELLTNRLDLEYAGLSSSPSIDITLRKMSTDYKLNFQNNLGYNYSIPIARLNPFLVGNGLYKFHFKEPNSANDYIIGKKDYLIVSNKRDIGGITTLLRLISVNYADQLVEFQDPALEEYYVKFEGEVGKSAFADMKIYGINHRVYVGNGSRISVDMNGDGAVNAATVPIITAGNGMIKASQAANSIDLDFIVPATLRENNRNDLHTKITISGNGVSIAPGDLEMQYDNVREQLVGMTDFGTLFMINKNVDIHGQAGDNLIINQPITQRFAEVVLKAYE
jgi:hypothetical protein